MAGSTGSELIQIHSIMTGFILKNFLEVCESRGLLKILNGSSSLENEVDWIKLSI